MDKTEKLIDWKEDERKDRIRDGIDDDHEPPVPDVSAGSQKLAERLREHTDTILSGGEASAFRETMRRERSPLAVRRWPKRSANGQRRTANDPAC